MDVTVAEQPLIPRNRWELLDPPSIGAWTPRLRVSVVVPAHNSQQSVERLVLSLGRQTYPHELLDVTVVDDASTTPVMLPTDEQGVAINVVRQESDGRFGAGRARNRGVLESSGDIVVFLDADMLVEPTFIEEHARWHHLVDHAVVTGVLRFVDIDLDQEQLGRLFEARTFGQVMSGREHDSQEWRVEHFARTADLTMDAPGLFRSTIGAVLSVRRNLFGAVGGFRELGIRGIEDTELGYRLHTGGGLFIVERGSSPWHQGRRFFDSSKANQVKTAREPVRRDLIPVAEMRPRPVRQRCRVPLVALTIRRGPDGAERVAEQATIDSFCRLPQLDIELWTSGDLVGQRSDPRVRPLDEVDPIDRVATPYLLELDAGVVLGVETVATLIEWFESWGVGVFHFMDLAGDRHEVATAVQQRAISRARWVLGAMQPGGPDDHDATGTAVLHATAGRAFGERWVPASAAGLGVRSARDSDSPTG